jgi:hypothetical protein
VTAVLSQAAETLDLEWTAGDPVAMSAIVRDGAGWVGAYTVVAATLPSTLTATVVASGPTDALLSLSMSSGLSAAVPAGVYGWRLKQTNGPSRLSGEIRVISAS